MLDEDEDPLIQWTRKYQLWSSYWREFKRTNNRWYLLHPIFIHDDYKLQVRADLNPDEIGERHSQKWLDKL